MRATPPHFFFLTAAAKCSCTTFPFPYITVTLSHTHTHTHTHSMQENSSAGSAPSVKTFPEGPHNLPSWKTTSANTDTHTHTHTAGWVHVRDSHFLSINTSKNDIYTDKGLDRPSSCTCSHGEASGSNRATPLPPPPPPPLLSIHTRLKGRTAVPGQIKGSDVLQRTCPSHHTRHSFPAHGQMRGTTRPVNICSARCLFPLCGYVIPRTPSMPRGSIKLCNNSVNSASCG